MAMRRFPHHLVRGSVYLTLLVVVLYFVFPPRLCLNHDGFCKVKPGMTLWEVEWLVGGPPGIYYPACGEGGGFMTREGSPHTQEGTTTRLERVWSDEKNRYEVGFDATGRVTGVHKRAYYSSDPNRPLALVVAFWRWALVFLALLVVPRIVWDPRRLDHEGFYRVEAGMTQKHVRHLLGGPPGVYSPTYEGARTRSSGPTYDGPTGAYSLDWWDDAERYTVYFDADDRVVGKHSPDGWHSSAFTCRLTGMLFGVLEPAPLPPQRFDGMMQAPAPVA